MRFIIYGAGAVGGTIGARLFQAGHDVTLIARGDHLRSIQKTGLRFRSPGDDVVLETPAVVHPDEIDFTPDDVVFLAMKTQDTADALRELAAAAPPEIGVVCAQNAVENERLAIRHFADVYGMVVMSPAAHMDPGEVMVYSTPVSGILDLGRYPVGVDARAEAIAAALETATFVSQPRPDIMAWKHRKLMMNLGNAIQAVCGRDAARGDVRRMASSEGEACLEAAGIAVISREEDRERRGDILVMGDIEGAARTGGSSWQSLARGVGSIEADYLNGEVVRIGREIGFPTPVNELLQRLANHAARMRWEPGHLTEEQVLSMLPG
ncbi:MAG: 2-dehydropantoate 2-reductase [Acidimicrobiia bacterium]|nr:2-dehydropantoate 2-reductase [Acidimicrobiia bacterium]